MFSFVFCVRKQTVNYVNEMSITEQEILNVANIKNGKPILLLNKEEAMQNLEKHYPNIKVVQIKTISLTEIEIVVRERFSLYYIQANEKFYVLDEELKILNIVEEEPTNLIKLTSKIDINKETEKAEFIGTEEEQLLHYELFVSVYSAVLSSEDKQARVDMANLIASVNLENDKLIIKTRDEVSLEIVKPNTDLTKKINICFAAIKELPPEQKSKATIKILYNAQGTEYKGYVNIEE